MSVKKYAINIIILKTDWYLQWIFAISQFLEHLHFGVF